MKIEVPSRAQEYVDIQIYGVGFIMPDRVLNCDDFEVMRILAKSLKGGHKTARK